jgi:hypothetical protein
VAVDAVAAAIIVGRAGVDDFGAAGAESEGVERATVLELDLGESWRGEPEAVALGCLAPVAGENQRAVFGVAQTAGVRFEARRADQAARCAGFMVGDPALDPPVAR